MILMIIQMKNFHDFDDHSDEDIAELVGIGMGNSLPRLQQNPLLAS
jgi:hypothetical protein